LGPWDVAHGSAQLLSGLLSGRHDDRVLLVNSSACDRRKGKEIGMKQWWPVGTVELPG
jgi:hypothetical protein